MSQILKRAGAVGFLLGGIFVGYRINTINKILGTQVIDQEEKMYRQEYTKENKLNSKNFDLSFEMNLLQERLSVYFDRLLCFQEYQELNETLIKEVVEPVLVSYQEEQTFEEDCKKILKHITSSHNFNNPVTPLFNKLFDKNSKLRQQKKGFIKDVFDMQNKLMTLRMVGLSDDQRQKIDLLFNFFAQKEIALYEMAKKKEKTDLQEPTSVNKEDYLSKIQMI